MKIRFRGFQKIPGTWKQNKSLSGGSSLNSPSTHHQSYYTPGETKQMTMENQPQLGGVSPKKDFLLIFQPAMLVFGMKKTQFSPSNLPGFQLPRLSDFGPNSTSALAMPSAKFPEALSGWYLTSFQCSRGVATWEAWVKFAAFSPLF